MATLPNNTGAPSGASNVVRLPTAAALKVDNFRHADQRRAVIEARRGNPWNAATQHCVTKAAEAKRRDDAVQNLQRDPALLLVMALIQATDSQTRDRVYSTAFLASMREPGCDATHSAYVIAARLAGRNVEEV